MQVIYCSVIIQIVMKNSGLKKMSLQRSDCPLACALDIIGDKWTLLILRDIFHGKHRFSEFLESGEDIKTNILTERLRRLEKAGFIKKEPYQDNPPRFEYHLTNTGKTLLPVIKSIVQWAHTHIPGTRKPRVST